MPGEQGIRTNTYTQDEAWRSPFTVYTPEPVYRQTIPDVKDIVDTIDKSEKAPSVEFQSENLDLIRESGDLQLPVESGFEGVQYYHGKNAVRNRQSREYKNTSILRIRTAKSASRLVYLTKEEPVFKSEDDPSELIQFLPGAYTDPIYKTKTKIKNPETNESEHQYYSLVKPTEKVVGRIMQDDSKKLAPRQRILTNITREFITEVNRAHLAEEQERAAHVLAAAGESAWGKFNDQSVNPFLRQSVPATSPVGEATVQGETGIEDVTYKFTNAAAEQAAEPDDADTAETPKVNEGRLPLPSYSSDEDTPKPEGEGDHTAPKRKRRTKQKDPSERVRGESSPEVGDTAPVNTHRGLGRVASAAMKPVRHVMPERFQTKAGYTVVSSFGTLALAATSLGLYSFIAGGEADKAFKELHASEEAVTQFEEKLATGLAGDSFAIEISGATAQAQMQVPTEEGMKPAPFIPMVAQELTERTNRDNNPVTPDEIPKIWEDMYGSDDNPDNDISPDSMQIGQAAISIEIEAAPVAVERKAIVVDLSQVQLRAAPHMKESSLNISSTQGGIGEFTSEQMITYQEQTSTPEFTAYARELAKEELVGSMHEDPRIVTEVKKAIEQQIRESAPDELPEDIAVEFIGELNNVNQTQQLEIQDDALITGYEAIDYGEVTIVEGAE